MSDRLSEGAHGTAGFYDGFWKRFGVKPSSEERGRATAICAAIRGLGYSATQTRILDLGCGRGWLAPALAQFGSVDGCDFSDEGIEFARANYGHHATFVLLTEGGPCDQAGWQHAYDIVVASEVIEHVADAGQFVSEVRNLLRPGGAMVLTTPNGRLWRRYRTDPRCIPYLQPIENWLRPWELAKIVRSCGFEVICHQGLRHPWLRYGSLSILESKRLAGLASRCSAERALAAVLAHVCLNQVLVAKTIVHGAD